ncbi:energy transducer TonB [Yoonia litorea]|uniref:Cell division and transport-associated protein TolA n=1 Tax=Yoonia litorea TaxID=1123755 RepID=A0A1I6N252_9RHOB|nr:energy transducer TonB [Yoonia litorea]SFS21967.1 Cell division and transport-associated protein TolA [Yoonia litorea]
MATPGTFISTAGHIGLIGWLIVGWGMNAEPLRIETMDVSVISGEEFDQMRAARTPVPGANPPDAPVIPAINPAPPEAPAPEPPSEVAPVPEPVTPPESETPPPPPPQPVETDVADDLPATPVTPEAPPPLPDLPQSDTPTPPRAPTVASQITAPPPPDATVDDVVRDAVVPDETSSADVRADEQEATAPEETTTQIVIDDLAPSTSVRPMTRPNRPTPPRENATAVAETPDPDPAPVADDVAAALEQALETTQPSAPAVPAGPPMTGAERDSFRIAVNRCWNVDPGSVAARVTVEVGFSLERDGTVRGGDVRLLSSDGDASATQTAFEAARRAILRCQSGGYDLPAEKYDQWQDVVITFDPSGMRLR